MALSSPASDTAVSATSTPDADLSSALGMLAMQDPSIPTPGKCNIDRCAVEIMIQVAESVDYKGLCSLARASKRYTEAAQDVLYRFVDLRPSIEDRRGNAFGRPTKSAIAAFLWTIRQKPRLATKVKDLWFLPRSEPVEYPQLGYSSVSLVSPVIKPGSHVTEIEDAELARHLLVHLTELHSLTITALDDYTCENELGEQAVFKRFKIPVKELLRLPCFSRLTSIYLSTGILDWAVVTLPTLHTLCLGSRASLQLPWVFTPALNVTSFIFEAADNALIGYFWEAVNLMVYLPNVHTLTLGSCVLGGRDPRFPIKKPAWCRNEPLGNLGLFRLDIIQAFLTEARLVESLIFTYAKPLQFADHTSIRLDIPSFEQLRRIQVAECALVDSHNFQRLEGSSPSQLLPRRIRTLVITYPRSPGPEDGDRKSKLTSWLGELTKTDFPDLERVEVVCSVGYGDDMGFKQRLEQSAEVRFLETIGVAVVVGKE